MKILRALCPHWIIPQLWKKTGEELGCFGMGMEWFALFKCRWCGDHGDQLRDGSHWQNHGCQSSEGG